MRTILTVVLVLMLSYVGYVLVWAAIGWLGNYYSTDIERHSIHIQALEPTWSKSGYYDRVPRVHQVT